MKQISSRPEGVNGARWQARVHAIAVTLFFVAAEAFAQEKAQAIKAMEIQREVVVSIPDRKLALVENGEVVKIYPVAVGKASTPSPTGEFTVKNRVTNPTYYHKGQVIPSGPTNPVGTRWIGLSQKGYGIHGTNAPRSIGKAASHGCIRMAKADLQELFELLRPGDKVLIVGERDDQTAQIFGGEPTVVATAKQNDDAPTVIATMQLGPATTSAVGGR
jgi:lipoprotein-anchoring transpeptidase ErfK/SrfK